MAERRVELGFDGGAVLSVTLEETIITELTDGLTDGRGWRSISAQEGTYWLKTDELVYVRIAPGSISSVGFGER